MAESKLIIRYRLWLFVKVYWKSLVCLVTPILLLVLPIAQNFSDPSKCAYMLLLMVIYWTLEILPLAVTSLIPVVLVPIMGIMSTGEISINYMKNTGMLIMGSKCCLVQRWAEYLDKT